MIPFLQKTPLFRGCTGEEIETILRHLGARTATFPKGALVCRAGERTEEMGLVLSGGVYIEHDDVWGNASLLGHVEAGQLFAEAYACVREEPMLVQNGGNTFDIPFNRQQLADYLEVDRSALSAELSKMQREGILTARKNHFVLHESAEE